MKTCSKCKTSKPTTEFNETKTNKDGLSYLCRDCNRNSSKAYRERHHKRYYDNQKAKRETENVFISQTLYALKTRAAKKGLEVNVTKEYLLHLLQESKYLCNVTGQKMSLVSHPRKKANAFKASLDRIDSTKGYLEGNIQWVCWAVNQMKSDKTEAEFKFWIETLYKAISSQA
jgi:protein-arginine kinase activator protein McsA